MAPNCKLLAPNYFSFEQNHLSHHSNESFVFVDSPKMIHQVPEQNLLHLKRKIKLGYVDISVTENWKIIQDHTKGRKLTSTPAITLYGDNKETPHWYKKPEKATAEGVHSWVSSYADHFGYGYWDPDQYRGAAAIPVHRRNYVWEDGVNRYNYGIGKRRAIDTARHNGALGKVGVAIGKNGKGYKTGGKWIQGDQITALKHDGEQTVMLRRTVTKGGSLSGLAHKNTTKKS